MRRLEPYGNPLLFDDLVPALDAGRGVANEIVAQLLVECVERRCFVGRQPTVANFQHGIHRAGEQVIVADLRLGLLREVQNPQPAIEVAVVGTLEDPGTAALLAETRHGLE